MLTSACRNHKLSEKRTYMQTPRHRLGYRRALAPTPALPRDRTHARVRTRASSRPLTHAARARWPLCGEIAESRIVSQKKRMKKRSLRAVATAEPSGVADRGSPAAGYQNASDLSVRPSCPAVLCPFYLCVDRRKRVCRHGVHVCGKKCPSIARLRASARIGID